MELAHGPWRVVLDPARGARFRGFAHAGRDILAPVAEGADPAQGFHGAFWMAPWANRLDAGRIAAGGVLHHMPITLPAENTALHGFARDLAWAVEAARADRARLSCTIAHAPFRARFALDVALDEAGLTIAAALTNAGGTPVPMGFGWHPFFLRPPGLRLAFRAGTVFGRDARNIAIAPRPCAGLQGGDAVLDGLDTHFAGWDGALQVRFADGFAWRMTATGAWARNLHFFAPPGAGVFCAEPVTHAPDAPNRPANAAHGALHPLAPGETLAAALRLEAAPLHG